MRRTIILAAALGIILLGLWGTFVLLLDEARLKGLVAEHLSQQTGRRVEIVGALRMSFFPRPRIEAERIVVGAPEPMDGPDLLSVESMSFSVRLLPLIRGDLVPGQVRLRGATVSLHTDSEGRSTADGLARVATHANLLSSRAFRLEDVTIVISDASMRRIDTIDINLIDVDRFALDRTAAFRFRGAIGDPALVDDFRVEGLLHVPSRSGAPVQLREMRMHGRLPAFDFDATLSGQLAISRGAPLRLGLAEGVLDAAGHSWSVTGDYRGGERPRLQLGVSGQRLDWPRLTAAMPASGRPDLSVLLSVVAGIDLRGQFQFAQVDTGSLPLADARLDLRTEAAGPRLGFAAAFPGGLVEAGGVLTGEAVESIPVDLSLADTVRLLEALSLPPAVDASGEANLILHWPVAGKAEATLEGPFQLWNGRWRVHDADAGEMALGFDEMAGSFRLHGGHLDLPALSLAGEDLDAFGWAAIELASGAIGGQLDLADGSRRLNLSGSLAETRVEAVEIEAAETIDDDESTEQTAPEQDEPR